MRESVTGLILAGGQGSRMGGRDKGLVAYQGNPLIDHVLGSIAPQVDEVLISANRNLEDYARRAYPVVSDTLAGFQGPLAGVLEGLRIARHDWVLTVPCDMPHLPGDLCARLMHARADKSIVIAVDAERSHPAVMLIQRSLAIALADYLQGGHRAVHKFQSQVGYATACFDAAQMQNINSI
jgi:molybdopterin-guanine dinucleotide biosynthesis protein A